MSDVAREAGVSRPLVSIAYRGIAGVSDDTRDRIFAAGAKLGYVHNQLAARLAGKSRNTIGVFLQDIHNEVFADVFDGIRSVTGPAGMHLVMGVGALDSSLDREAFETLLASQVDVVVAMGVQMGDADYRDFGSRVPIVSIARELAGIDNVVSDDEAGASLATEHLIGRGHRSILFLSNPQSDGYLGRQRGYRHTMAAHGLSPRVVETTYSRADAARDAGAAIDSPDRPTAIFAHNDRTALGVLDALSTRGLVAGRDIAVVGYDNTSASGSPLSELTSVDTHAIDMGRRAAELALARLAEPDRTPMTVEVAPTLVIRGSTV